MTRVNDCGAGYASYDEHPGYDYRATYGTIVKAAASGYVLNIAGERCYRSNITTTCSGSGYVGINHGNNGGYISQYGHLQVSSITVNPGQWVNRGKEIGRSGCTGLRKCSAADNYAGSHLHFEVLKVVNGKYLVVDPYGWVGGGTDPLYSSGSVPPANLWQ